MESGGSFRWSKSNSHSSVLLSESVTSECARIASYERISRSMRLTGECDFDFNFRDGRKKRRKEGLGILSKVFTFRKISTADVRPDVAAAAAEQKKEKKLFSWLPDPNRRWPIQGW